MFRGPNIVLLSSGLLLAQTLLTPECFSLNPTKDISQYNHRIWLKRDGLPQNSVLALAQTPDGYLWAGTFEGLARFDGLSFNIYNPMNSPALHGRTIRSLYVSHDSTLWIGIWGRGGLAMMKNEVLSSVDLGQKDSEIVVISMCEGLDGRMWIGSDKGLFSIRRGALERRYSTTEGLPNAPVTAIARDSSGRIFVVADEKIFALTNGHFVDVLPFGQSPAHIRTIAFGPDGRVWAGTMDEGLLSVWHGRSHRYTVADGLPSPQVNALHVDNSGVVWVGTLGGLSRIHGSKIATYRPSDGLSGDEVQSLLTDREGNLWVGVATGGLNRFVDGAFTTYVGEGNPTRNFVYSVFLDADAKLLAGAASREVLIYHEGRFIPDQEIPRKLLGIPLAFYRDSGKRLWIGTSRGLYIGKDGRFTHFPLGFIGSIQKDPGGRMWVGSSKGLLYHAHDGTFRSFPLSPTSGYFGVRLIHFDRQGMMWIGTMSDGLFRMRIPPRGADLEHVRPSELKHFTAEDGLHSGWISSLIEESDGTMWVVSYGGGLAKIRDNRVANATGGGIHEVELHSLCEDAQGWFWMSSNNGIFRARRKDIEEYLAGRKSAFTWTQFGLSAGMASDECNGGSQNSSVTTADGRIWFPTTSGVSVVDPDSLPTNLIPPPTNLEYVRVGRQDVPHFRTLSSFDEGDIEFGYNAVSLSAPEGVRFRVKLDGFDAGWIDATDRRIASYTNLPPGNYRFVVQAVNADGVWNTTGSSYAFTIEPRFYQTWWFFAVCASLVMLTGAGLHAVYRRDRDRQLVAAQLESKLAQAQLKVLEMQMQPHFLFNTLNGISVLIREDPDSATRMIARLSEFLRIALDRSGVQEIPLREELLFVDRYLQIELLRFADRLTVQRQIEEDLLDALVPTMILQPIIENAIRHGVSKRRGPVTIRIEARRENGTLALHVRDDGAGLPGGVGMVREGIGLTNTRARLQQLYGEHQNLELFSPSSGGVDVELTIPFHTTSSAR